jgi:DNA-binding Lrp family transcriptional regulator
VDAKDYAIYRYLSPDGLARFWASRRLVDPRVTAREIAARVGLSEAGVRARLRSLQADGLLRGSAVSLNPSLFDASVVVVDVPVRTPRESDRLFQDLAVVDGVVFARDVLDEEDRDVAVYLVSDSPAGTARRVALVRRLSPTGALRGPRPYWIPPCPRPPTALDWRLLAAFRRQPDSTVAAIAQDAGVGLKTTARRFDLLLESHACWWSHSSDSEEWPLALLALTLETEADRSAVSAEASTACGTWLPVAADGLGLAPGDLNATVGGLVPVVTPASLETTVRKVLDLDGVASVRRTFGLRSATYPQWTDERLAERLRGAG